MARQINRADLDYAASQLKDQSGMMFGSRPWEKYIELNEADLWLEMVGDCAGEHNQEMRRVLTIVYAPLYRLFRGHLPALPRETLDGLVTVYPAADSCEEMSDRLEVLMSPYGTIWSGIVLKCFQQSSLSLEQMYRVCLYSLLLLESASVPVDAQVVDPIPPPTPTPEENTSSKDRHQCPTLTPITDNPVRFADIGGYSDIRVQFNDLVAIINQSGVMERWGADIPRGILLNGPSGVGKTYWAHALANEINRPFFDIKRSQVTSPYVNESAKWIEEVFVQVKKAGGGVIFLDEVDGLLFSRGAGSISGEDHKVITALNTCLQRPEVSDGIFIVMATNRKDLLDSATIRPERIDVIIDFKNPNINDRGEIFKARCRRAEKRAGRHIFQRKLSRRLVIDTEGFSCADIAEVVRRVLAQRARRELAGEPDSPIVTQDFLSVISQYRAERFTKQKPRIGFSST